MKSKQSPIADRTNSSSVVATVLRALVHRNYRLFFAGQSISLIGTWMTRIATSWLVYRLTDSALLLGVVGFAGQLPTFLLAPFAGVWVDRLNRHRLLLVTQVLAMLQVLVLAFLTLTNAINVHGILWLSVFQGIINAFDMPARQAFLVEMIEDPHDLANAIALNSSMVNMARLIGPSIGGIVIGIVGEGICFLIDGISYIAVIASLFAMKLTPVATRRTRGGMTSELREGWQYVSSFAPVRSILILLAIVSLFGMPYTVLMPVFASEVLHGNSYTLGFLMAATGIGALVSALRLAARRSVLGLGKVVSLSAATFGAGLIAFSFSRTIWLSLPLMFVVGFGMMQQMAASNTIIQTLASDDMRGRVMSYYTMAVVGMAPFGSLLAGSVANAFSAPSTLLVTGVFCVAGGVWFYTQLKSIRPLMRPIYVKLGILPEIASGLKAASDLQTPPAN